MSTRAWYEYHVLDPATSRRSLAMQFYKWGDATPGHALDEWTLLQDQIKNTDGLLPVVWLDDLLREQLGDFHQRLPAHFSIAAFLFMIQRAKEELHPYRNWGYHRLPLEERPDYRLGFAVGKAMALNRFQLRKYHDPHLDRVTTFIAAGHFVRPWREYGLTLSVLEWLQYLTQVTMTLDMGSIAGDLKVPIHDISYRYRFFIWLDPATPFKIERLAVELCDRNGRNLFRKMEDDRDKTDDESVYIRQQCNTLMDEIEQQQVDQFSLEQAETMFEPGEDTFWGSYCHERPPLPPSLQPREPSF